MNHLRRQLVGAVSLVAVLVIVASGCSTDGRNMKASKPDQTQSIAITTTVDSTLESTLETTPSPDFALTGIWTEGDAINATYTCQGESVSPPMQFSGVPAGTVTLGLVLTDQDANGLIHWAVANIAAADTSIAEGALPDGAIQATTDQGTVGYWGPCPPAGQTHHYVMTAYAIAQQLEFADGVDALTLQTALEAGALAIAETGFISQTP